MRVGFIFRNQGPSLKVHHGQCLTSMTKHDSGGSPPGAAFQSHVLCTKTYGVTNMHGEYMDIHDRIAYLMQVTVGRVVSKLVQLQIEVL